MQVKIPKGITINCEDCRAFWEGALRYWGNLEEITTDRKHIELFCPSCTGGRNVREDSSKT